MRWKKPNPGDTRIKKKFLFLPKEIKGETRWLEYVSYEEIYTGIHGIDVEWRVTEWDVSPNKRRKK